MVAVGIIYAGYHLADDLSVVANHAGLQWATARNLLMAWVLTLPASIALAGAPYWPLRRLL